MHQQDKTPTPASVPKRSSHATVMPARRTVSHRPGIARRSLKVADSGQSKAASRASGQNLPQSALSGLGPDRQLDLNMCSEHESGSGSGADWAASDGEGFDGHASDCEDSNASRWRQREAFHLAKGRSKSKRKSSSQRLVDREYEHWTVYCQKTNCDPKQTLLCCMANKFKAYLEWRCEKFRIKKESSIKAYWRRILCSYIDAAEHSIDDGTELDVQNFIPTELTPKYGLDTSKKEKHAMHVQDLYAVLQAHWTMDPKPCHGRFRVQMAAILLLCGATATRPQALIESSSARNSNKALWYKHITILRVRDPQDRDRTTTVVLVSLVHIKNAGSTGTRKRFIFRLESVPAFCIVSHIISLTIADGAFRRNFNSPAEIFNLAIKDRKDSLHVKFKKSFAERPLFRDLERPADGGDVSDTRALPYHKCRDHLVSLGRVAGFEQSLELYQLRRASGRRLNTELSPEERNQAMGHHGDTYQRFYMPDLIERDFQSIYFGTLSQEALIQHAARMGISRDDRAPLGLTDKQKLEFKAELRQNPEFLQLHAARNKHKQTIREQGFQQVEAARGTKSYKLYDEARRKINSLTNGLRRRKEEQAILEFHDMIDDHDIEWQLGGNCYKDMPSRSTVNYEFHERAAIARLLSQPLHELEERHATELRLKFMDHLVMYCTLQESRQKSRQASPQATVARRASYMDGSTIAIVPKRERSPSDTRGRKRQRTQSSSSVEEDDNNCLAPSIPLKFTDRVCLVCIGDKRLSPAKRLQSFATRDTLRKHKHSHQGRNF